MSSMRLSLLLSAAFTASLAPSALLALAQDAVRGADLDCPAEVAAFLATVRADEAYPRVAEMLATTEAGLDVTMRTDGPDCLVLLRDAQRVLVDANVVMAGASDPASVERVARLEGAVAEPTFRTVEITPPAAEAADTPGMTVVDLEPTVPVAVPDATTMPDGAIPAADVPPVARRPEPVSEVATGTEGAVAAEAVADADPATPSLAVREVEFGFDSAQVPGDASTSVLSDVAGMLEANTGAIVLLTGHASPMGNAAYNLKLSERRVAAIAEALRSLGVPEAAISTRAQGEDNPEVRAGEDELSEENRRVEIRVVLGNAPDRG